jgi:hypothetical protein
MCILWRWPFEGTDSEASKFDQSGSHWSTLNRLLESALLLRLQKVAGGAFDLLDARRHAL